MHAWSIYNYEEYLHHRMKRGTTGSCKGGALPYLMLNICSASIQHPSCNHTATMLILFYWSQMSVTVFSLYAVSHPIGSHHIFKKWSPGGNLSVFQFSTTSKFEFNARHCMEREYLKGIPRGFICHMIITPSCVNCLFWLPHLNQWFMKLPDENPL